ncbi:MAG: DUF4340 domain-containing protein [Phycisphaeraceae bacterium]|nr:DUF4340 domain-containing protein [Phycisphaerales bacterium]MCB9860035.1 DUF4340 domain-containing protein [Phycisphaeraceae bacterium]
MNAKSLGMLVFVALIVGVIATLAVFLQQKNPSTASTKLPDVLFASLEDKVNDISQMRIENKGETVTLSSSGNGWTVDSYEGYPARFEPVKKLIMEIAQAKPVETKTDKKDLLGRLDLDDPSPENSASLITLSGKDGSPLAALVIGKTDSSGQRSYVRKAGETQAYTADKRFSVLTMGSQWVDTSIIKLPRTDVWTVTVTHPDGDQIQLWRESPDESSFTLLNLPEGRTAKPANQIGASTSALAFLSLTNVTKPATEAGPDESQIEALGITSPDPVTVEYLSFDQLKVVCTIWQAESSAWMMLHAESTSDPASADEINSRTRGWLYEIGQYAATNMTPRLESLLEPASPGSGPVGPAGG